MTKCSSHIYCDLIRSIKKRIILIQFLKKRFILYKKILISKPEIKQEHPLNLSISVSGGKETNKDYLSSGERKGKSSSLKSAAQVVEL